MSGSKIPLAAKMAVTAFLAVLVPVYLHTYGPTNFLWFCDAALILTVAGMWLESPLLISTCAVGILLPQCLWLADFDFNLLVLRKTFAETQPAGDLKLFPILFI